MIYDLKNDVIKADSSVILSKFLKFPNEYNIKHIMKESFKIAIDINGQDKLENELLKKKNNLCE